MRPYIDTEKNNFPIILLTADTDWDPSSIDYEHDEEHWFDTMGNLPDLICNHPFDEHGDYIHTHKIEANLQTLEYTSNNNNNIISDNQLLYATYPHEIFE